MLRTRHVHVYRTVNSCTYVHTGFCAPFALVDVWLCSRWRCTLASGRHRALPLPCVCLAHKRPQREEEKNRSLLCRRLAANIFNRELYVFDIFTEDDEDAAMFHANTAGTTRQIVFMTRKYDSRVSTTPPPVVSCVCVFSYRRFCRFGVIKTPQIAFSPNKKRVAIAPECCCRKRKRVRINGACPMHAT